MMDSPEVLLHGDIPYFRADNNPLKQAFFSDDRLYESRLYKFNVCDSIKQGTNSFMPLNVLSLAN